MQYMRHNSYQILGGNEKLPLFRPLTFGGPVLPFHAFRLEFLEEKFQGLPSKSSYLPPPLKYKRLESLYVENLP